ncbi:hypothetical protein CQW39_18170 [Streptomyces griseofuscus]|uniref:Uncharacterized protein n=1 Tax=Streptomyces griseofuscus TaxID=146922 RepID=A0A426S076_9ACTN|nr:hypothetical protein [Streptomyces griseofuscus]RRQ77501.1 hypothetical protein CQW39_18170 [Streptomyces griseofuscus]RRQ82711.1 hypothetical protein CQW44_27340 [Streptomyces griseofuscus]
MRPDDGTGGLKVGLEALKTFKTRVDSVLKTFEGSPGSAKKVAMHTITAASFCGNGGFPEATGLHSQYTRVHDRLMTLSQSLTLQIEAMQIAVHGADIGFANLDDDQRRRFHEIRMKINEQCADAQKDQKRGDDAQVGDGDI